MHLKFFSAIISLVVGASLASAKECNGGGGECVSHFHGSSCQGTNFIGDYVPTCGGNCFQYSSFDSLLVEGSLFLGTDCHVYSDYNCQNQIVDTGNILGTSCYNTPGAQSMRCFYDC
ncbi:hypothetical protein DFH08DRAFT_960797 [Mycena albidolilacea]|uniref:Uncharacterized protein n=1 Tax=Mycena albidolilacea TaxID=1033008 RepID=A0AAD7A296_9AGAR|nr:hypothetical protein DFH08DRAFT_960797 [Mycena albidolilacea]